MGSKVQTRAEEVERNYKESTIYIHEFDTELEPSFTGSIRVNGTLYSFDNETPTAASWAAIKTAGVDTQVYVKAVPSGDSCTLEYTTTAPTFSTSKLGWYSPTVGQENHRYITDSCEEGYLVFGAYLDTTDLYVYKHIKGSGRFDRITTIAVNGTPDIYATEDDVYKINLVYGENVITEHPQVTLLRGGSFTYAMISSVSIIAGAYSAGAINITSLGWSSMSITYAKGSASQSFDGGSGVITSGKVFFRLER